MAYWFHEFKEDLQFLLDKGFRSKAALGKRLGVSRQTIRNWNAAERPIDIEEKKMMKVSRLAADLRSKLEKNNDEVSNV